MRYITLVPSNGRDPNGEGADLKSVGCKNFAGSSPVSSVGTR